MKPWAEMGQDYYLVYWNEKVPSPRFAWNLYELIYFCFPWNFQDTSVYWYFEGSNEIQVVGNKAKGQISNLMLQENNARQISRKMNISYLMIRTHTHVHIRG